MAKIYSLSAEARKRSGTSALKKMRLEGLIPSIVYGRGFENQNLKVNAREFSQLISRNASENILVNLEVKNQSPQLAFIQDIHHHTVTGEILHADFLAIDKNTEITAQVAIFLEGDPIGVHKGGLLSQQIHSLEIKCLPDYLPESISASIDHLDIDDYLYLKDIQLPDNVNTSSQSNLIIAVVAKMRATVSEESASGSEEQSSPSDSAPKEEEAKSENSDS